MILINALRLPEGGIALVLKWNMYLTCGFYPILIGYSSNKLLTLTSPDNIRSAL